MTQICCYARLCLACLHIFCYSTLFAKLFTKQNPSTWKSKRVRIVASCFLQMGSNTTATDQNWLTASLSCWPSNKAFATWNSLTPRTLWLASSSLESCRSWIEFKTHWPMNDLWVPHTAILQNGNRRIWINSVFLPHETDYPWSPTASELWCEAPVPIGQMFSKRLPQHRLCPLRKSPKFEHQSSSSQRCFRCVVRGPKTVSHKKSERQFFLWNDCGDNPTPQKHQQKLLAQTRIVYLWVEPERHPPLCRSKPNTETA